MIGRVAAEVFVDERCGKIRIAADGHLNGSGLPHGFVIFIVAVDVDGTGRVREVRRHKEVAVVVAEYPVNGDLLRHVRLLLLLPSDGGYCIHGNMNVNTKTTKKEKNLGGRPPGQVQDANLHMRVNRGFLAQIDDWRRHQPDLPNRTEAIRRLVESALQRGK